jgi:hypothetical protein
MLTTELETFIVKKRGRKLKCKCSYEWIYCGKSELYAHCPKCRSTVTINPKRKYPGQDCNVSEFSVADAEVGFTASPTAEDLGDD